jgi:HemY protein
MIRVVIYLLAVGALALGAAWLADRPGDVMITWQGRRIETSVMVLTIAVVAIAVLTTMFWSTLRTILRSPDTLWRYLRARRGVRGYLAVSQGLIAVGSGDARAARRFADEAKRIAPNEPLTLLLGAQASQLAGDRAAAEAAFHAMAARDDTRLLGLHGLFVEAQRRQDPVAACLYAEQAGTGASVPAWAGHAVLEFRCAAGDWSGALERLDHNMKSGLIDKDAYRRQRAVLLSAQALAAEDGDRDVARDLAQEAARLAPTLVPAAALAGRLLGEHGELRKAARIVEAAWKANPHPDLADTYAHLRPGASARDRLKRIEALAALAPGDIEAALAVARAALDAQEFAIARQALTPLTAAPTQRVAMLMAELEEREHGDEGRAREWMTRAVHARRDPAWTADGFVSERWLPVSPVTGRLDAFEWKDPLAGTAGETPVIEDARGAHALLDRSPAAAHDDMPRAERGTSADDTAAPAPVDDSLRRLREGAAPPVVASPPVPRVIPLVQVPDDPGPEPDPQTEPQRQSAPDASGEGWPRLRGLFR